MGRFSTTVHIKNDVDRMSFVNTFGDVFRNELRERDYKEMSHELNAKENLSPKIKEGLEMRMKNNLDGREEAKKKNYDNFTNPELQENAPAELERRKKTQRSSGAAVWIYKQKKHGTIIQATRSDWKNAPRLCYMMNYEKIIR